MKNYLLFIFIFSTFLFCNSCKLLQRTADKAKALAQCSFKLKDVHKKISFKEKTNNLFNYVVTLDIAGINPTKENIKLGEYKLDLYANGKWIGDVASTVPIALRPYDTTMIEEKIIISPRGAIGILFKKLFDISIEYKLCGTFYLNLKGFIFPLQADLIKFVDK